jgi:hypothetical protein
MGLTSEEGKAHHAGKMGKNEILHITEEGFFRYTYQLFINVSREKSDTVDRSRQEVEWADNFLQEEFS